MKHKGNTDKWGLHPNGTAKLGPSKRQQQRISGYKNPSRLKRDMKRHKSNELYKKLKRINDELTIYAPRRAAKFAADIAKHSNVIQANFRPLFAEAQPYRMAA